MNIRDMLPYDMMRKFVDSTMLVRIDVYRMLHTYDEFGQLTPEYELAGMVYGGVKRLRISEQPSFTGVAKQIDALIRLPRSAVNIVSSESRLAVYENDVEELYDVIGDIHTTMYTLIAEVERVQT